MKQTAFYNINKNNNNNTWVNKKLYDATTKNTNKTSSWSNNNNLMGARCWYNNIGLYRWPVTLVYPCGRVIPGISQFT